MDEEKILRKYARKADPQSLPPTIRFEYDEHTLTVYDAYPKSVFHFLILPRIVPPLTAGRLASLRTLLQGDKAQAKEVLDRLDAAAKIVREQIEAEMLNRFGYKWSIWTGFHAVQSMEHVHLHVISSDLCSPSMKNKKHYNSFHPEHGFFLPLEEILSWPEAEPSWYATMSELRPSQYEPFLKESLSCWRCYKEFKNMPLLKEHLQEEWDAEAKRERARLERKQKLEQDRLKKADRGESPSAKRQRESSPSDPEPKRQRADSPSQSTQD
ncbi:HIT-like protein [Wolfiporia cocos MD-104 SS10]|uniref:HIT-like protein n=1 Tax=Wolfiporia cocos (strain MD-104) TaxID=742152 RepID=A0A2H3JGW7_WOLCO|nr:HIT-like protein [Wolfiporia cocos MD-104 SS10]